ncbi:hypothetical protein [Streptacidiphilus sp. P02-A3a]|uniref:hypothetical protein n=1 Tax=Streptacidiphilus sp. P02-A3a TaxID=2704468 RepID=UPI0015F91F73|nr:hypothetical protein [Streptacidiphilus sp. P02-A3a]QMU70765.1 hypothetical protein GXP74_23685 [Streptacidiphilus sp. P02-A3a]
MGQFLAVLAIIACLVRIVTVDKHDQEGRGCVLSLLLMAAITVLGFYVIES